MQKNLPTLKGPPPADGGSRSNPPNQCLYIQNLPEKVRKPDLRTALYMLFSTYGPVLDVVALKNGRMRGQAHVVFRDTQTSTQAMRALQGFEFFGKEMKIQYGKGRSNVFTRLEGAYKPPTVPQESAASTELQKSIFSAPLPGSAPEAPPPGLPPKPQGSIVDGGQVKNETTQGTKRPREDDSDEEEAAMEEDEDEDVEMEASSDED